MQNAVCFEQPSRLRIDDVGKAPAGQGCDPALQRVSANPMGRRRLMRIQKCAVGRNGHPGLHTGQIHGETGIGRGGRPHLDQAGRVCKPAACHIDAIRPERQSAENGQACLIRFDRLPELVRDANYLNRTRERQATRVGDRDAQLSRVALRELREREKDRQGPRSHIRHIVQAL
jgi:hypothetical protein